MAQQTQTYRPTATATPSIGGLLRLLAAIGLIVLIAGWLFSSWRAGEVIAPSEPLPSVQKDPEVVQTYQIPTGNPEFPQLSFTVETIASGYNLVDPDGDVWFCEAMPATLASMEQCSFMETR